MEGAHETESSGALFVTRANSQIALDDFRQSVRHILWCLAVAAVFGSSNVTAQVFYREWVRTYALDGSRTNESLKVLLVADGVVVGGSSAGEAGDLDYVVIKYRANGEEVWRQRYNAEAGSQDVLRDLAVDPAGSVFVTGTSKSVKYSADGVFRWAAPFAGRGVAAGTNFVYVTGFSETDFATVQLANNDTDGRQGWVRMYDVLNGAGSPYGITNISEVVALTRSEELLVAGWEKYNSPRPGNAFFTVIKYATNGQEKWKGGTGIWPPGSIPQARKIAIANDGSVYMLGSLSLGGEVTKFSSEGVHQWTIRPGRLDQMAAMDLTAEQQLIYAGAGAVKLSSNPVVEASPWVHIFTNRTARLQSLVAKADGNIYGAGFENSGAGNLNMLVVKISSNGILLSTNVYDSAHHGNDLVTGMVTDELGNFYVTGYCTTAAGGSEFVTIKYSEGPRIERRVDGAMGLEFHTAAGQLYGLDVTTNFLGWESWMTNRADTNGVVRFEDGDAGMMGKRFYRGKAAE